MSPSNRQNFSVEVQNNMEPMVDISTDDFFNTATLPVQKRVAGRKRKHPNRSVIENASSDVDEGPAAHFVSNAFMKPHVTYTEYQESEEIISVVEAPNQPPKCVSLAQRLTEFQERKPDLKSFILFRFMHYCVVKGQHVYTGMLIDIKTQNYEDMNMFEQILRAKPMVRVALAPIWKEQPAKTRVSHPERSINMPKFKESDILVLTDPVLMLRTQTAVHVTGKTLKTFSESHLKETF